MTEASLPPESGKDGLTRRAALTGATALAAGVALSACGGSGSATANSTTSTVPAGPVKRGGTLRVAMTGGGQAESLDPLNGIYNFADVAKVNNIFDGLLVVGPKGDLVKQLAEEFEPANPTGTQWDIRVRDGVEWHNGKTLAADDVIWTLKAWANPKNAADAAILASYVDLPGLKKLDARTVRVPLKAPNTVWDTFWQTPGTRLVQAGTTNYNKPVGTGPFKFKSWTQGVVAKLERFENYWQTGKPYLDAVEIHSVSDPNARMSALLAGQLDAAAVIPFAQARQYQNGSQVQVMVTVSPSMVPLTMRTDAAPFDDVRVRQAFRLIVDRPAMIKQVQLGFGGVANDLSGKGLRYYNDQLPQREQDLEKAQALLRQAGHEKLSITLNTSNGYPIFLESATVFRQQAQAAGVTVNLNLIPGDSYFTKGWLSYVFSQSEWSLNSIPGFINVAFSATAPYNETHWKNPTFQKLFVDALAEPDETKRADKFFELQRMQWEDGGYINWGLPAYTDGLAKNVHGATPNPSWPLTNLTFTDYWLA